MTIIKKDATVTNVARDDDFPGSFQVILSAPTKDRDGETLTPEMLEAAGKRGAMMSFLREQTYGMAPSKMRRHIAIAEADFIRKPPAIFN